MSPALMGIAFILLLILLLSLAKMYLSFALVHTIMFVVGIGVVSAGIVVFVNRPRK